MDELSTFFLTCDKISSRPGDGVHRWLPVIFRMIYGCGLRVNEALSLKVEDVNFDESFIILKDTKNDVDRIIPMDTSLTNVCIQYAMIRLTDSRKKQYFFFKKNGERISGDTIYRWFREILWNAGISHGGKGLGPRVHDFRHTFSVNSLKKMSEAGLDLYYSLPILSKYLGHQSLEATDKYVRLTAEMYPDIIKDVNNLCSYIFPEVGHGTY